MDEKIRKWLYDMLLSIEEIESFQNGKPKSFHEYKNDLLFKRAVERNLEIIGEAMNRILKADSSFEAKLKESKQIISLRNYIAHSYDNVSDENIWSILVSHLPKLKDDIQILLQKNS